MITNSTEMLQKARKEHYAVPAFNINNLEWTKAILTAAQEAQSPVIIQVTGGAASYMGSFRLAYDLVVDMINALNITVPVSIHLDHGNYFQAIKTLGIKYTSIMFDGSALPLDENLEKTRTLVKLAHDEDVSVEAEVGTIGGEEDGIIASGEIAPIDSAVKMAETGVDMLAVGIGNIHGKYPANWKGLDFDHLKEIAAAVDKATGEELPLVLHGGSGIPDDQIKEAIQLGISKVNVNTEGQLAFHQAIRDYVHSDKDLEGKDYDPRIFLANGTKAIENMCLERIKVFGSANKA